MKIGTILVKVILALVVIVGISSCTKPGGTTVAEGDVDYYTCTMHPSVHSKTPGKCPICSMDLVTVLKKVAITDGSKSDSGEPASPASSQKPPMSQDVAPAFKSMLGAYDRIRESLAKDQIEGVAGQAVALRGSVRRLISLNPELMKEEGYRNALIKLRRTAESFDARNLEDARAQFGFFSADLIAFLKLNRALMDHPLYTVKCPMWKESPAQWIQTTPQVKNPFLGTQMPDCGQVSGPLQAQK